MKRATALRSDPRGGTRSKAGQALQGDESSLRLGKVLDFMRLLWAVDHGLQTTSKRMESDHGVTGMQRLVIRMVGRFPGISAGELAEVLHVHPSTLSGVLQRLAKRGVLKRQVAPDDGRRALFFLKEAGEELDALQIGTTESAVRRSMARHSPEELAIAEHVLATLARELTEGGGSGSQR